MDQPNCHQLPLSYVEQTNFLSQIDSMGVLPRSYKPRNEFLVVADSTGLPLLLKL